jgi:DNA-binding MurR/RpiR family transcriptional regulator
MSAERHPRVTPTARTIVRASTISTAQARNDAATSTTSLVIADALSCVVFTTMTREHDDNTTFGPASRLGRITGAAERRVADYLVRAGSKAAPMSAQEIAAAVGTSDATVVRTARTLGYANLRELRRALADESDETDLATRLQATIGDSPTAHDVLANAVERHLEALDTLLRRVPAADFDRAARVLSDAAHVWWCGTGPSAHLANYAAFLCRRLGTPSGSLTHAGTDHADELL